MNTYLGYYKYKALVTGSTGFIGGHLVSQLLTDGWQVKQLVRDLSKLDRKLSPNCHLISGDITELDSLREAVKGVDVVFHCAANVSTWASWDDYRRVNVDGVRNLVQVIADINPSLRRVVHLSTVDVYGYPELPAREDSPLSGAGFGYGESKLQGEHVLQECCNRYGVPYTILRPTNVMGPGSQFILRIGRELRNGVMLKINGGLANTGFLYIDHLIDVLLWASRSERAAGEIYNVNDEFDVNWHQFLKAFRRAIDGRGLVVDLPYAIASGLAQAIEKSYGLVKITQEPFLHSMLVRMFGRTCAHPSQKLRRHGGPLPRLDFQEAMKQSVDWFLKK